MITNVPAAIVDEWLGRNGFFVVATRYSLCMVSVVSVFYWFYMCSGWLSCGLSF